MLADAIRKHLGANHQLTIRSLGEVASLHLKGIGVSEPRQKAVSPHPVGLECFFFPHKIGHLSIDQLGKMGIFAVPIYHPSMVCVPTWMAKIYSKCIGTYTIHGSYMG